METGLVKRWIYAGVSLAALLSVMVSVVVAGTQGASGAQDATETVELVVDDGTETAVATGETTADATGEATNGAKLQASASLFAAIYAGTCADTGGEPTYQVGDLLTAKRFRQRMPMTPRRSVRPMPGRCSTRRRRWR